MQVPSDMFVAGNRSMDKSIRGKIIFDESKAQEYWLEKIGQGERPSVLVGAKAGGGLQVLDGNHRMAAYTELGIEDVPIILTKEAQSNILAVSSLSSKALKYKSAE